MDIRAYFFGEPNGLREKACHAIFKEYDGEFIGCGTLLVGPTAGERDVHYDVPEDRAEVCKATLKKAGYKLMPSIATVTV